MEKNLILRSPSSQILLSPLLVASYRGREFRVLGSRSGCRMQEGTCRRKKELVISDRGNYSNTKQIKILECIIFELEFD